MSRRTKKFDRPVETENITQVFANNIEKPLVYNIRSLSVRGEFLRITNFDGIPRLNLTVRTPNGFTNIVSVRLTNEGIEKAKDRLNRVLKALEILQKMNEEGKIKIPKETLVTAKEEDEFSKYL
ncbi:MAG: hypothetical protein QXT14_08960 [Candidatus Bathyarchaeia archaeon]